MYQIQPEPAEPKPRYVVVTDPDVIAAIQKPGLCDPIGHFDEATGQWLAESQWLAYYRESLEQR